MPPFFARRLIILSILLVQCYSVWTQPLRFTKFQQEHFVTTIFQDKLGFLWLGTPAGLQRYDGYHFKSFRNDKTDSLSLSNDEVWNIVQDDADNIWVGTNNGLNRLDPGRETFTRIKSDIARPDGLTNDQIIDLLADTAGTVWVATANGLNRYLPEADGFKRYLFHPDTVRPSRTPIQSRNGTIWVGVKDTLYRYDVAADSFTGIRLPGNDEVANFIRLIYEDHAGYLWIGTQLNGAFRFDPHQLTFPEQYNHEPDNPNSLSNNKVSAFIQNGEDLWIGTTGGGLNVLNLKTKQITPYTGTPPDPFGINSETIRDTWEDNRGNIWLGSYYDGLYQFKNSQRIFRNIDQNTGLLSKKVNDIEETADGKIWISMGTGGLAVFDAENHRFTDYYQYEPEKTIGLPPGNLIRMHKDKDGKLWVASENGGISRFETESGVFKRQLPKQPEDLPYLVLLKDFLVEENGDVWIARQEGLVKFVAATQSFRPYALQEEKNPTVDHGPNIYVSSIYRDRQGQLWLTTNGGLNLYRPETDSFELYPFHNHVLQIVEDESGTFWVGGVDGIYIFDRKKYTFSKAAFPAVPGTPLLEDRQMRIWFFNNFNIIRYDPATNKTIFLNRQDGLAGNLYWTAHLSRNGYLFLGGIDGLAVFHPDSLQDAPQPPQVVLTDFRLFNQRVPLKDSHGDTLEWKSPLTKSITFTESIRLQHWQNYFSLEFAALDFTAPATNRYQYQLEGYDQDWVTTEADRRFVTYTNLNPDTYTFRVKGATRNGPWSTEAAILQIRILPPWWSTWWAYLLYAGLFFLTVRTIYQFQLKRRIAVNEAKRLKELDHVKNRLFTNITHEFRTPLTIILGMARQIKDDPKRWYNKGLQMITYNGRQLLGLVNQMLDLSKLDNGKLELKMQQGEVIGFIHYLVQSFESFAAGKNIQLHFLKDMGQLEMDFDPDQLTKVVSNLLSNAVKYTPEGGLVYVTVRSKTDEVSTTTEFLELRVKDTGPGIPPEELHRIFDRFYQTDSSATRKADGSGLGLALTKELVQLMGGQIRVQSKVGEGTHFSVLLPISRSASKTATAMDLNGFQDLIRDPDITAAVVGGVPLNHENQMEIQDSAFRNGDLPLVLLIEDNRDVLTYIASCLQANYQLEFATNGREGINQALEIVPDIIISDIMMPEKDGYEVCTALKEDIRTSHIPIILLTARAGRDAKLEGLKAGADAYLAKPFDKEELNIRLEKLLDLRRQLQAHYSKLPSTTQAEEQYMSKEELFLKDLREVVRANLSDESFGVVQLCRKVGLSRSQLHNKLKALTGQSASIYIRTIRLERAKDLLQNTDWNISEIAYEVGFRTPLYFTQVFSKEVGVAPSAFRMNKGMPLG